MQLLVKEHRIQRPKNIDAQVEVTMTADVKDPEKVDSMFYALKQAFECVQQKLDEAQ